jgi:hypothetical protein
MSEVLKQDFKVYLLQAEADDDWVEQRLAQRLADHEKMALFFFKWQSIPGQSRQDTMVDGFNRSKCCAVCIGPQGLGGLAAMLEQVATQRRAKTAASESPYNLIPVILPGGDPKLIPPLLQELEAVDFRDDSDFDWQFHRLVCAINEQPVGRRPTPVSAEQTSGASTANDRQKQTEEDWVHILGVINTGVAKGLSSEREAAAFRRAAFKEVMKRVIKSSPAPSAQESR